MADLSKKPNEKQIMLHEKLFNDILSGTYASGDKIPSDVELSKEFGLSRPTVAKIIKMLEQKGLVVRKPGAGTFVQRPEDELQNKIGLLLPRLAVNPQDHDHFVSLNSIIISEISRRAQENNHILLLNDLPFGNEKEVIHQCEQISQQLINNRVKGVFFMPFELSAENEQINVLIANRFSDSGIAVTLLDRDVYRDGRRSEYDIVCVDNERSVCELTKHLIAQGSRKIDFVASKVNVTSIQKRIEGYQNALKTEGGRCEGGRIHRLPFLPFSEQDITFETNAVSDFLDELDADALVCANDRLASTIMKHALARGLDIPGQLRIVGFDDEPFGAYLPIPLTTMQQPAKALGAEAMRVLISRSQEMDMPPREIMLKAELVVRQSCGTKIDTSTLSVQGMNSLL